MNQTKDLTKLPLYALSIQNLRKTYSGGFEALKGIDLTVDQGDFFALLGPNGAGKSTTIGIVSSLVNKTSGKVEIFGIDKDKDIEKAKSMLGIVPQEFNFAIFEDIYQIILNQAGYYGIPRSQAKEKADYYLNLLGLYDKKDTQARNLSGGMKRRLMIARALVHEPKLLILDEPTAGVDIELRRSMWDFLIDLNKKGTTIILTTHYLEEAESLCRNIAIIDRGRIIQNTSMKKLLNQLDYETFILDCKSKILKLPVSKYMQFSLLDDRTIEVVISKKASINDLYSVLDKEKISVISMRNKANRLEELFLKLVEKS
jgi:ABC-2 type transport system ATP-binding protein